VKVAVSGLLARSSAVRGHYGKLGLIRDYINYAYALAESGQARLSPSSIRTFYGAHGIGAEAEGVRFLARKRSDSDNLWQYPQFYQIRSLR
jgi:hypothetical protein